MQSRHLPRGAMAAVALSALLTGCVVAPVGPYYSDYPPPAPHVELIGVPPLIGHFWIGGHWRWGGRAHAWTPGYWQAPRHGYRWAPHGWRQGNRGWRESPGRWERR